MRRQSRTKYTMSTFPVPLIRPNSWLTQLARTKPAKWRWCRAIRTGICVGLPLGVGALTGLIDITLWVSIAALMLAPSENNGSYHSRLKAVAISSGIGSLGCLAGYIGLLPWVWIPFIMGALAISAGIISSYGAPFSAAMLQFLAISAVAIGLPQIAPFWKPTLCLLSGGAFYALLLLLEALLLHRQPRRQMATDLIDALAQLALCRATAIEQEAKDTAGQRPAQRDSTQTSNSAQTDSSQTSNSTQTHTARRLEVENRRRAVTTAQSTLYADIFSSHARRAGRTSEIDSIWALLQSSDDVLAAILSSASSSSLRAAAADLLAVREAVTVGKKPQKPTHAPAAAPDNDPLVRAILSMANIKQWSHSPFSPIMQTSSQSAPARRSRLDVLRDQSLPGKATLHSALALALCVTISYMAHWVDKDTRWYWVPLTVAIIMKPDFGSIFARSLARSIGTVIGALVGTVILILFPKGFGLVFVVVVLASSVPWAVQYSYAVLAIIITPLVLVLIDFSVPGSLNVNYAGERLISTVIGAGIVLVFGYFIWPRTHAKEIAANFQKANSAIAAYLLAAARLEPTAGSGQPAQPLARLRRTAYSLLTDLRTQLQKNMSEPPPAGSEATAWLPIVASSERICDLITAYSTGNEAPKPAAVQSTLRRLAAAIAAAPENAPEKSNWQNDPDALPAVERTFIHDIADQLRFISRCTDPVAAEPAAGFQAEPQVKTY